MSLRSLFLAGVMAMRVDAQYVTGTTAVCSPNMLLSETQCQDFCSSEYPRLVWGTSSVAFEIAGCFENGYNCFFNSHPTGVPDVPSGESVFCLAPTPQPTAAPTTGHQTVSGDPIFKINGFTMKFDLPLNVDTLLLSGHGIDVFGRADVTTPDYKNQWFSTVSILKDKFMSALIERKALRATHPEHQALNSLSFVLTNQDGRMIISNPGEYEGGEFTVRHAGMLGRDIPREVVTVKLRGFEFAVGAQIAKKFKEKEMQLNYAHLDFDLHDMRPATKGLFAELFGIIPMSKDTVQLIKNVHK